jgi:hypothetical protein
MDKQYLQVEISKEALTALIGSGRLVVEDVRALNVISKECLRNTLLLSLLDEMT